MLNITLQKYLFLGGNGTKIVSKLQKIDNILRKFWVSKNSTEKVPKSPRQILVGPSSKFYRLSDGTKLMWGPLRTNYYFCS
jgi:hypothetical protein